MLNINRLVLGPVQTNCYIVENEDTKEAIVFDPADNAKEIIKCIEKEGLTVKGILLTHGHFDHISAADELRAHCGCKLYAHENEEELLKSPELNLSTSFTGHPVSTNADIYVKDKEELTLAGIKIQVIYTPGHTRGGCCYYFPEHMLLISGDTLFRGTVGRTDFPTGDYDTLLTFIKTRLFELDDEVQVLPGHNDITTIGYEKQYNSEL
ncbi:MAG: MBL fold metallo-hydrolase [bacterium]|nr:MBL fold metallo-hydrolase [bacterium]